MNIQIPPSSSGKNATKLKSLSTVYYASVLSSTTFFALYYTLYNPIKAKIKPHAIMIRFLISPSLNSSS
jgi:hypothetical protein